MPMIVVVGAQWGDEGKGKIVDLLAEQADVVARYGGGANAGHTVWVNGVKHVTHLLPSGILQGKVCVLGAGMVIGLKQLLEEIADFAKNGADVSPRQIMISPAAHIVLPTHKALDAAYDNARGANALGTTKRGIGPAYADKALRRGLRAGMIASPTEFGRRAYELTQIHNQLLELFCGAPADPDDVATEYESHAKRLADYVQDTALYLHDSLTEGKTVLAEGAQGTLLDIDHGGYPFVTSSSTVAGAAATGLGVSPMFISEIIGVAKAFQTRVGEGPMPTEIIGNDKLTNRFRGDKDKPGAEYGATTGRPRRVGWLDLPALRKAIRINGIRKLALTKLDILSGFESIKLCVDCKESEAETHALYEDILGWSEDISQARDFNDLPVNAKCYVRRIEKLVERPISLVSVGTDRDQIIRR